MEVVIGQVDRPHGVRGELLIEVRSDQPEERFAVGAVVRSTREDSSEEGHDSFTIVSTRWHGPRLLVRLAEVDGRDQAERLRGAALMADVATDERPEDPEEFPDQRLIGLEVRTLTGQSVGEVSEVLHLPMQDVLGVRCGDGRQVLVPFVHAIVPEVDLMRGRLIIDPPQGLIDGG